VNLVLSRNPAVIGFFDECSPQTTANTQRLWSFTKPTVKKNTTRLRANTFGFYAILGNSVVDFKEKSRKEDIIEFLEEIRENNPQGRIMIVLDNFRSHHANLTLEKAEKLNIDLVFLPPYSPNLNPIEFIWKTVKRELSPLFIETKNQLKELIQKYFIQCVKSTSFAKKWIEKFLKNKLKKFSD
jgi:putative transposase